MLRGPRARAVARHQHAVLRSDDRALHRLRDSRHSQVQDVHGGGQLGQRPVDAHVPVAVLPLRAGAVLLRGPLPDPEPDDLLRAHRGVEGLRPAGDGDDRDTHRLHAAPDVDEAVALGHDEWDRLRHGLDAPPDADVRHPEHGQRAEGEHRADDGHDDHRRVDRLVRPRVLPRRLQPPRPEALLRPVHLPPQGGGRGPGPPAAADAAAEDRRELLHRLRRPPGAQRPLRHRALQAPAPRRAPHGRDPDAAVVRRRNHRRARVPQEDHHREDARVHAADQGALRGHGHLPGHVVRLPGGAWHIAGEGGRGVPVAPERGAGGADAGRVRAQ
mmetsp:Transcript_68537/g.193336  ORF Transcript_68537/g.193336 Transcript_68537/m.193336 type:complete len:329 (-) Transcript_68537:661-1647(-)